MYACTIVSENGDREPFSIIVFLSHLKTKFVRTLANESHICCTHDCFPPISTDLDDDTRIVRAGRTGKAEDDVVFYMVRDASL